MAVSASAGPFFVDRTEDVGLSFLHDAGASDEKHLPETMGHGVVLFDPDEDGDLDLYVVQSGPLQGERPPNRLFLYEGGSFEDRTEASGDAAHRGYGMGAACGDADGDGHLDLYLTCFDDDALLLGDGRGGFRDATVQSGLADPRWTTGAVYFDADWDGDLDLYVTAYVEVDLDHPVWCGRREPGWRTVCHPDRYDGLQDRLWINQGDGAFLNATETHGVADSLGKGLGVVASDIDDDGFLDLYVANDSVENRLWHNQGDGTFVDESLISGTGVNRYGATEAGMGLASGDIDGDGDFDLYVTNFDHESNTLYRNDGQLFFTDHTPSFGLEAPTRLPVGFGTLLQDFDNDTDLDIALVNGHIVDLIERYHDGQTYRQKALYFENAKGLFNDRSEAVGDLTSRPRVGRSLISGDVDGDGDLDLIATECGGPLVFLRNEFMGERGLFLAGLPPGVRVIATLEDGRVLHREAGPQPSYLGQTAAQMHLGLAGVSLSRIELRWGEQSQLIELAEPLRAGQHRFEPAADGWKLERGASD